jgi:aspartate/methionine/tyrosine aminotransferase
MPHPWIADRALSFDSSGIRKVFELAAKLKDPINLSIGQPDFDVPEAARQAAIDAIQNRENGYAVTQGVPELRDRLQADVDRFLGHPDRKLFVTSGTSGGLVLAMMALVNPSDEVILFDPYFVMYEPLVKLMGAQAVLVDTNPTFQIDIERVRRAMTPRTKAILFNSPANPTGYVANEVEVRALAELAREKNVALISDEIYRLFCYDAPFVSPARYNDQTIVIDGFSKTWAMTGWRVGWAHGPAAVIDEMIKIQQYSFVCAPHPFQVAAAAALDIDMQPYVDQYREKRHRLLQGIREDYEVTAPGGAFYVFPKAPLGDGYPWKNATEFVARAIENELLIIPGKIFSQHDDHFRISYAADDRTIDRGIEVLRRLAAG